MTTSIDRLEAQLDRLVDGELSPSEYGELIALLDASPALWRRCAMAFLEAQTLRQELCCWRELFVAPAQPVVVPARPHSHTLRAMLPTLAAVAMGFVLALPLGGIWFTQREAPATPSPQPGKIVASSTQTKTAAGPSGMGWESTSALEPVANLEISVGDKSVDVPVYHVDSAAQWLEQDHDSAIDRELLQAVKQAGHRISRERRVLPFELDDGGQVLVPVDSYRITPAVHQIQ